MKTNNKKIVNIWRLRCCRILVVFTYLVTKDIVETLERKIGYKLSDSLREDIKFLENEFLYRFWQYIPDNIRKTAIDANTVSKELENIIQLTGHPIISLDKVYLTNADEYLEVTRLTDPKTGNITISERQGYRPIEEQINSLKKYKKIVLADVGAFEGGTLLDVSNMLERNGLEIEEIYLGFSSNEANKRINNSRKLTVLNLFDFYEWIEMRDLFGIDGRAVSNDLGIKTYIPYSENLSGWASIPKENEKTVSEICNQYYLKLIQKLSKGGFDLNKIGKIMRLDGGK